MKLNVSAIVLMASLTVGSFAQAFQIEVQTQVNGTSAAAQACNDGYPQPIVCNTTAIGVLANGATIYSTNRFVLNPGQCNWAYVYSYYPYPMNIVDAQGEADCEFY